jgi:alkylation response protein AidB-like acyl-CoA dehydrogenase
MPDAVRAELRDWLAANWDEDLPLREWRERLVASGWGRPDWPPDWHGRGLPPDARAVADEELRAAGAPGVATGVGTFLVAPAMLEHGDDDLRRRFLAPILAGSQTWTQLFSEPGAGSDLASLSTRAIPDGDEWRVTGQKVWSSNAHRADYGLLLARTGGSGSKHAGITCMALPMRQPGVEVRPLRQMNGHSSFNEVFLDDAVVPAGHLIGAVGEGWAVARTTLAHERRAFAAIMRPPPSGGGRAGAEAAEEAAAYYETYRWYPQRAGRADLLVERAQETGHADDPVVRQQLVAAVSLDRLARWTAARASAANAAGRPPGPEGSLAKLASVRIARAAAAVHAQLSGADGMLTGPQSPADGVIAEVLVSVPAISIAGGTDEIQKNIVAERVLGLPKEPSG